MSARSRPTVSSPPGVACLEGYQPSNDETTIHAAGVLSAIADVSAPTPLQVAVANGVLTAMTGRTPDLSRPQHVTPEELAQVLNPTDRTRRSRIVQLMVLTARIGRSGQRPNLDRLRRYAHALEVDDDTIDLTETVASWATNAINEDLRRTDPPGSCSPSPEHIEAVSAAQPWATVIDDNLAERWRQLAALPTGSLGRTMADFYRSRRFHRPGSPGSISPLLAQHDWVHVLADYGTTLEGEIEVFGLIARACPDIHGFALLATVIDVFETGVIPTAFGSFDVNPGHLSTTGMATRLADAMRRGALVGTDLMNIDWFDLAHHNLSDVRLQFALPDKSPAAIDAGSASIWQRAAYSAYQWNRRPTEPVPT
jgi:hypothetical protein